MLLAEPQPHVHSPLQVLSFYFPPLLGVFFTSKVPANISPGPWTWSKAYCGSERGDSPTLSCVGPAVISLRRAGWFASIQCGPPALTARVPALAQKARCYLRCNVATAVGPSSSELPTALSKCTVVSLASPVLSFPGTAVRGWFSLEVL